MDTLRMLPNALPAPLPACLQSVEIANTRSTGIEVRNGANLIIQDNYLHDLGGSGMVLGGGARNVLVQRNVIRGFADRGILLGSDQTEAQYMSATFAALFDPEWHDNINSTVRHNVVSNGLGAGIAFYSARDATVYNNTFANNSATMHAGVILNVSPKQISLTQVSTGGWAQSAHHSTSLQCVQCACAVQTACTAAHQISNHVQNGFNLSNQGRSIHCPRLAAAQFHQVLSRIAPTPCNRPANAAGGRGSQPQHQLLQQHRDHGSRISTSHGGVPHHGWYNALRTSRLLQPQRHLLPSPTARHRPPHLPHLPHLWAGRSRQYSRHEQSPWHA